VVKIFLGEFRETDPEIPISGVILFTIKYLYKKYINS
jgi:hypothetical protein